ncbi:hypothetical protein BDW59DRAFT_16556 [Aspergillus cavernicola]|uniref:Uncharacterized protein n=1 Tax=Aspergillus cavernicola TaxID=176166 RepID=A0ABR4HIN5_9EURO
MLCWSTIEKASTPRVHVSHQIAHCPLWFLFHSRASAWAGARWVGVYGSNAREQQSETDGFQGLWKLAQENPQCGLYITKLTEILEYGFPEDIWYRHFVPDFRLLDKSELTPRAAYGMSYSTIRISPPVFLPWMRARLEARGVKSLGDLSRPAGFQTTIRQDSRLRRSSQKRGSHYCFRWKALAAKQEGVLHHPKGR